MVGGLEGNHQWNNITLIQQTGSCVAQIALFFCPSTAVWLSARRLKPTAPFFPPSTLLPQDTPRHFFGKNERAEGEVVGWGGGGKLEVATTSVSLCTCQCTHTHAQGPPVNKSSTTSWLLPRTFEPNRKLQWRRRRWGGVIEGGTVLMSFFF